ncbi:hypothetical protein J2R98_001657 [Alkalibacillus filiformis]|uniref:DUF3953 domain-containing protein n=1 Tax=Alkalibacillus filiformis TaxID=200990 RepID=A0ABU0DTQ0_9BACI|nr:hypothetical protein [Alkalibacillus filiformis]MDQ0351825.1 hypothetical protein [Alkalibacillus filiformis]
MWKFLYGILIISVFSLAIFEFITESKLVPSGIVSLTLAVLVAGYGVGFIKENHRFYGYSFIFLALLFLTTGLIQI